VTSVTGEDQFSLEFTSEPDFISTARLFAGAAARYYGCDEEAVQDVKIAVSEACTNAVKAHGLALVAMPIRVIVRSVGDRVEFNVIDAGGGFERTGNGERQEPDTDALLENGIGLQIIQALFPDTDVGPNNEGGTTVRFSTPRSGERF
jgi:serine/threonine-protein kinase RsbW